MIYKVPTKEEIGKIITEELIGRLFEARTLTVRKEYNPYLGEWYKVPPRDGEGIRAIKDAITKRYNIATPDDFNVYSKEEEKDHILYVEFYLPAETIIYSADVFEQQLKQ